MAGNNPYNPQTNYAEWQAWEQEQARKGSQTATQQAQTKKDSGNPYTKRDVNGNITEYKGRKIPSSVQVKTEEEAENRFKVLDAEQKGNKKPAEEEESFTDAVKRGLEEAAKTRDKINMYHEGKDKDGNVLTEEQRTQAMKDVAATAHEDSALQNLGEGNEEGFIQDVSDKSTAAAKKAQAGVNRLGDFDMPKGNVNDLSTYELIGDKAKQEGIFPKSIWQAWKKGEFGDPEGKESQQVRNNLILNSAMTAIGNAARGFRAGLNHGDAEHKDSLWKKRQEANMERQTERENQQLDVLKQAETDTQLADMWGSFTPAQKQGLLDAKNAFANGKYADAQDLMRSSMGDEKYAQWLQYFDNLKAQLSINADARAQEQLRYMEAMGPLGLAVSLLGKFI
jgi:hypothetical protein